jgi:hypothetical protein
MFRNIRDPNENLTVASPEDIADAIRHALPGRFIVEDVSHAGHLLPSGHSCRRWGTAARLHNGQVTLDPDLGPARGDATEAPSKLASP